MALTLERQAELEAMANEHTDAIIAVGACTDPRKPTNEEEEMYFHQKMNDLMKVKCIPPPSPQ